MNNGLERDGCFSDISFLKNSTNSKVTLKITRFKSEVSLIFCSATTDIGQIFNSSVCQFHSLMILSIFFSILVWKWKRIVMVQMLITQEILVLHAEFLRKQYIWAHIIIQNEGKCWFRNRFLKSLLHRFVFLFFSGQCFSSHERRLQSLRYW